MNHNSFRLLFRCREPKLVFFVADLDFFWLQTKVMSIMWL